MADAQDWLEAIDVDDGEYTAALTETGRVIRMRTQDGLVVLELTDELDAGLLRTLLREHDPPHVRDRPFSVCELSDAIRRRSRRAWSPSLFDVVTTFWRVQADR